MSEPYLPVPDPEPNSNLDPQPPRCPECGTIVDAHPASRGDGEWEGWCEKHGTVKPVYLSQDSEITQEKERAMRDDEIVVQIGKAQEFVGQLRETMREIIDHAEAANATAHAALYRDVETDLDGVWKGLGMAYDTMAYGDPADYEE